MKISRQLVGAASMLLLAGGIALAPDASGCPYYDGNCVTIGAGSSVEPTPAERQEADRRAAQLKAEQQLRQQEIDAEVARLGSHRRAEAERMVELRRAAERARPKFTDVRPKMCDVPAGSWPIQGIGKTVVEAQADIRNSMPNICSATGLPRNPAGTIVGNIKCTAPKAMKFETNTLYTSASCSATYRCSARKLPCPSSSGAASRATSQ